MTSAPPRFVINSASINGDQASIAGAELHHLRDVMRLRRGDAVALVDERGRNFAGRIQSLDAQAALIRIERIEQPHIALPLILAIAIIKGPRMDLAIEKAAELGASEIWPILCARCVVRDPGRERLARWRRLAAAACKQSLAARPVEIKEPIDFLELPGRLPSAILPILCQPGAPPLAAVLRRATHNGILIACGPEGDFTPDEIAAAEQAGFIRASLGPNRLRTETAALAALAIATSAIDDLTPKQQ